MKGLADSVSHEGLVSKMVPSMYPDTAPKGTSKLPETLEDTNPIGCIPEGLASQNYHFGVSNV